MPVPQDLGLDPDVRQQGLDRPAGPSLLPVAEEALARMMTRMMAPSVTSPNATDRTVPATRIRMIGLVNCTASRCRPP